MKQKNKQKLHNFGAGYFARLFFYPFSTMKQLPILTFIILITLLSCKRPDNTNNQKSPYAVEATNGKGALTADTFHYTSEYMLLGTLYHQQAAEYRALCYQAYNLGKLILDKDLADTKVDKHRIVILDVDETVLDNSPYQAQCVIENINYPEKWEEWCNKASAKAIPGSLDFIDYAKANGLSVYYITNRKDVVKEATIQNLQKLGFPDADKEHVITRSTENSKEGRRNALSAKYHISLFVGDNLSDFSNVFDEKPNAERFDQTDKLRKEFGSRFIVLPNSMYGDWELALYDKNKKASDSLKSALRYKALKGF